ncbi:hypothetical protein F5Y13DRAFT_190371 [Hypoxylon sp. FL1857]|nr:hypothetical protein F5Y13DRAFT_190371 [Hypoxylon sp. FL1857]
MSDYLEYFDFDAFSGTDEYTFDFNDLDNTTAIGQEEQNSATDFNSSLLPDATAATVEPMVMNAQRALSFDWLSSPSAQRTSIKVLGPMNAKAETESSISQPFCSTTTPEARGDSQEPTVQLDSNAGLQIHQQKPEASEHHRVEEASQNSCATCSISFDDNGGLERHSSSAGHSAYVCSCDTGFTRLDALRRHVKSFDRRLPQFPCTFCKGHRGKHGFRRRDHLVQHLSGYHKFDTEEIRKVFPRNATDYDCFVCPLPGCEFHRGQEFFRLGWSEQRAQAPFRRRSNFNKHLKDAHKATPYPCPVAGCDRVEANGYMTGKGLTEHLAREHPNAPQHLTKLREELQTWYYKCDQCEERIEGLGYFNIHCRLFHQL